MKKQWLYFVLLVLTLAEIWPQMAQSQGQPQTAIMHKSIEPGTDSLSLKVLFTVLDSRGQAISKDAVRFEGGGQAFGPAIPGVEASVAEATTPIRIVLVIDASGSMAEEIDGVRKAAINFVRKTPPNAEIAVFKFSDEVTQVQPFTKKDQIGLVENAILEINNRAVGTGNTCIYKAAYDAIKAANTGIDQSTAMRPAVVLFTDGKDSEVAGQSCGEIKEEQVVTQARQSGVTPTQVHTIGLCDAAHCNNLNADALESLAEKTNASTIVGNLGKIDSLFDKILSVLNNQWLASAQVQPKQGQNTISFRFNARINDLATPISLTTDFNSDREYSARPQIVIASRTFDAEQKKYMVQLDVANPQQIKQLTMILRDANNNTVWEDPIQNINPTTLVEVPAEDLKERGEFFIDVKAIDVNGAEVKDAEGKLPSMRGVHELPPGKRLSFEFALPPVFNRENGTFEIKLNQVQGSSDATLLYKGSITEENTAVMEIPQGVFDGSDIVVPLPAAEVAELNQAQQPKKYTIKLRLIDQVGNQEVNGEQSTTIHPPEQPGFVGRVGQALFSLPVLVAIGLFGAIGLGFFAYNRLQKRKPVILPPEPLYNPLTSIPPNAVEGYRKAEAAAPGNKTELDNGLNQPQIHINVVATPEPHLNRSDVIKRFPCVIGRENSAFLIKGDVKVSRQHVEIDLQGSQIIVKDLGSRNGTAFVRPDPKSTSGAMVETMRIAKGGSVEWDHESLIRLGPSTLLELRPQRSSEDGESSGFNYQDGNRTQMHI